MPNTKVALLIFGSKIYEQIGFSEGQRAVTDRLRQLRTDTKEARILVRGKTALYDSLLAGLQLFGTPTSADIIYVMSDGEDTASTAKFDDVAGRLDASGVRLFASLVSGWLGNRPPTPEEANGPLKLQDLVKWTGGEMMVPFNTGLHVQANKFEQTSAALNNFHQNMVHSYRMEVEIPGPLDKRHTVELKPANAKEKRWKNVHITYPEVLEACKP